MHICDSKHEQHSVKEYQRKQLVERLDREGATVGIRIPETIEVQGSELGLREFVFDITRQDILSPSDEARVEEVKLGLRRERLERRRQIEEDPISHEEGDRLVESILGIDRALNVLTQLGDTDLEAEAAAKQAADQKRWVSFVKQALGSDSTTRRF